jgi:hypothetical protein
MKSIFLLIRLMICYLNGYIEIMLEGLKLFCSRLVRVIRKEEILKNWDSWEIETTTRQSATIGSVYVKQYVESHYQS